MMPSKLATLKPGEWSFKTGFNPLKDKPKSELMTAITRQWYKDTRNTSRAMTNEIFRQYCKDEEKMKLVVTAEGWYRGRAGEIKGFQTFIEDADDEDSIMTNAPEASAGSTSNTLSDEEGFISANASSIASALKQTKRRGASVKEKAAAAAAEKKANLAERDARDAAKAAKAAEAVAAAKAAAKAAAAAAKKDKINAVKNGKITKQKSPEKAATKKPAMPDDDYVPTPGAPWCAATTKSSGVVSPNPRGPDGGITKHIYSGKGRVAKDGTYIPRALNGICAICDGRLLDIRSAAEHFESCVKTNGNPYGRHWFYPEMVGGVLTLRSHQLVQRSADPSRVRVSNQKDHDEAEAKGMEDGTKRFKKYNK